MTIGFGFLSELWMANHVLSTPKDAVEAETTRRHSTSKDTKVVSGSQVVHVGNLSLENKTVLRTIFQLEFGITTELRWTTRNGIETGLAWRQSPRSFTFCGFAAPRPLRFKPARMNFSRKFLDIKKKLSSKFRWKTVREFFWGGTFNNFCETTCQWFFVGQKKPPNCVVSPAPPISEVQSPNMSWNASWTLQPWTQLTRRRRSQRCTNLGWLVGSRFLQGSLIRFYLCHVFWIFAKKRWYQIIKLHYIIYYTIIHILHILCDNISIYVLVQIPSSKLTWLSDVFPIEDETIPLPTMLVYGSVHWLFNKNSHIVPW